MAARSSKTICFIITSPLKPWHLPSNLGLNSSFPNNFQYSFACLFQSMWPAKGRTKIPTKEKNTSSGPFRSWWRLRAIEPCPIRLAIVCACLYIVYISFKKHVWRFPKITVPPNHPFWWEFPILTIHFGVRPFMETSIYVSRLFMLVDTCLLSRQSANTIDGCENFQSATFVSTRSSACLGIKIIPTASTL